MGSGNIQVNLYSIDRESSGNVSNSRLVDTIIKSHNKKKGKKTREKFKEQQIISEADLGNYDVRIFYARTKSDPQWIEFLAPILNTESELLKWKNDTVSFIGFIFNESDIFAISGGLGNFVVQEYINQNFGIEILSRLIKDDENVISSLSERGVAGSILANSKYFRGSSKLSYEDEFGKVYRTIEAYLDKTKLREKLGFSEDELKKGAKCFAKNSFKLNKSVSINRLLRLIDDIIELLAEDELFILNKVQLISSKGNKDKRKRLFDALYRELYGDFASDNIDPDFDLCHRDFAEYLTADYYRVVEKPTGRNMLGEDLDELKDLGFLFTSLRETNDLVFTNVADFAGFLDKIYIESKSVDDSLITTGKLIKHIHGEIELSGKNYFYIDGDWFEIRDEFIADLNTEFSELFQDTFVPDLLPFSWSEVGLSENDYNKQYIGLESTWVFDRITPENIELCDILRIINGKLYFIHVKKKFSAAIRDLTAQITIAYRRVSEAYMSSDYSIFEKLYDEIESKSNSESPYSIEVFKQIDGIDKGVFVDIFRNTQPKDVYFGLAFVDTVRTNRSALHNIGDFGSNIAKFEIVGLIKEIKSSRSNIQLKTYQIDR